MVAAGRLFYPKADIEVSDELLRGLSELGPQLALEDARAALASTGRTAAELTATDFHGTFHEIFSASGPAGESWILKANRVPRLFHDGSPAVEQLVSDRLCARALKHGKVLAADSSRRAVDFDFAVLEWVDGRSFRLFDDDEDAVQRALPAVANYLRDCHEIAGYGCGLILNGTPAGRSGPQTEWLTYLRTRLDEHLELALDAGLISSTERAKITALLGDAASSIRLERPRLLHGDCGPHNTLLQPDGSIAMIDWEDALFGDPVFDVAMWATFNPARRWDRFFAAYFGENWAPELSFWLYFLRISLAKCVVRLRFGYVDAPGHEPSAERIQRALNAISTLER